jgi:dienelactone hydrolase
MDIKRGLSAVLCALAVSLGALADQAPAPAGPATETRAAFLQVIDRPRVDAKAELQPLLTLDGSKRLHLWYSADARERVPGYIQFPDAKKFKGRRPVVIALHGTGGVKEGAEVGAFIEKVAAAGFLGVAIDGRVHGERTELGGEAIAYNNAIARAFKNGDSHPLYYDTVWDVMRLIDYLVTRKDVDPARIGLVGFSKGGIETYLAAAADPRVAAAVSYIAVQSFKWGLDNGAWRARVLTIEEGYNSAAKDAGRAPREVEFAREFYARLVPGIDGQFDGPAMLPLIAPRPLLVVNGDSDANTPLAGVRLAVRAAEQAYAAAGAADKFSFVLQENTGHAVRPENIDAGVAWFVKHLAP